MSVPSYVQLAIDKLKQAELDDNLRYHLCAILTQGGKVISVGFNHSNSKSWAVRMREHELCEGLTYKDIGYKNTHAEMDAIYKAIRQRSFKSLKQSKLYVARLSGSNFAMARPCELCQAILFRYNVTKVVYTINPTQYGYLRILAGGLNKDKTFSF
jgi:deoxycytidylate deaminase